VKVNLAIRRTPKPHVTVKYLEPDFTGLFRNGLRGLAPDGSQDSAFHGRELARNAAVGDLALATGLRSLRRQGAEVRRPCRPARRRLPARRARKHVASAAEPFLVDDPRRLKSGKRIAPRPTAPNP